LERGQFLLERANVLENLADSRRHLVGGAAQLAGEPAERGLERLQIVQRMGAGEGLDPTHAGGDAALGDDLEQADVAGALHVRAAAELSAPAEVEDPAPAPQFLA